MRINYNILNIFILSRFVSFILLIKCNEINFDLKFSIIYKSSIIIRLKCFKYKMYNNMYYNDSKQKNHILNIITFIEIERMKKSNVFIELLVISETVKSNNNCINKYKLLGCLFALKIISKYDYERFPVR